MKFIKNPKLKKIISGGQEFVQRINDHHLAAYATYVSFFILLSLIPFVLGMTEILSSIAFKDPLLKTELWEWLPANTLDMIQGFMDNLTQKRSEFTLPIAGLVVLWSASKGAMALMKGLYIAFDEEIKANFILVRIFAFLFTVGFMLLVFASGLVLVFGEFVLALLHDFLGFNFPQTVYLLKNWIPFFMLIVMISLAYFSIVRKKYRFRQVLPGAIFATLGFMLSAWAMNYYILASTNLSYMYGSLAGVAGLMMWINICSTCILMGAEINAFLVAKGFLH